MRKKILIAVDASLHSRNALDYAVRIHALMKDVDFVLLNIQPIISQYLLEEALKRSKARQELEAVYEANRVASEQLLEDLKGRMVESGVAADSIETRTQQRSDGIAEDIISCAETNAYDAVIVGRRGISGLQEFFMGSVTANLLVHAKVIPVWVVDGAVNSSSILVAVDGSPSSLRTVDHVAFVLSGNRDIALTFLNVQPRVGDVCEVDPRPAEIAELDAAMRASNEKCITNFAAVAKGVLQKAGFEEKQIVFRTEKKQLRVGKAIVDTLKKENFGTVVIGKNGAGKNSHMGSVAGQVLQKASSRAVWMVP